MQNAADFRPTTKVPTFRLNEERTKAIPASLWQSALPDSIPRQNPGDFKRGQELFETRGCLGCHSITEAEEGGEIQGGNFAADLSRVGEKVNYDYLVRWVHNPRQRLRPSLGESSSLICPRCLGTGHVRGVQSSGLSILRMIQEEAMKENTAAVHVHLPVETATYLLNEKRMEIRAIESRIGTPVMIIPTSELETPHYHIRRLRIDEYEAEADVPSYELDIVEEEEEEDPRADLVRQLLEYQRYREAALSLAERPLLNRDIFVREPLTDDAEVAQSTEPARLRVTGRDVMAAAPRWDLVLAADVWYDRFLAERATPWLRRLAQGGATVLLGDIGRAHFPRAGLVQHASYAVSTTQSLEREAVSAARVCEIGRVTAIRL